MAPGVCAPDGTVGAKLRLEPAHAFAAVARRRRPAVAGAGWPERGPRFIPGRAATQGGPAEAAVADSSAPSGSASRPPAWAAQRRPHSLALPRRLATSTALARDDLHVERALAGSGPEAQFHRSRPPSGGRLRASRQRARPLGLGGTVRVPWGRPAAYGGRRPRWRAIRAPSVVARRPSMGPDPHRRLRGSRPRRVSRPRLAGRRRPWPYSSAARAAHAPAVHDCHGDDHAGPETTAGRRRVMSDVVLFRRLFSQARPYWPHVVALFLLSLLSSPLSLLTPLPLKIAVDSVIGSHPLPHVIAPLVPEAITRSPGALLAFAIGLLVAVALLRQLQGLTNTLLQAYVKEKLVQNFRARLFRHVQRLSLAYHDARGTSDSTYRIQHDATAIQYVLIESVIPFISAAVTLAGMIYVMTRIDWQLALIALAISPGLVVTGRIFRRRLRRHSREAKKLESSTMSIVQEVLGALRVVKAFGQEAREEERFIRRSTEGMKVRLRLASLEGSFNVLVGLATAAGMAAVLHIGVRHVGAGVLTLGELLMVMAYMNQLYEPLKTISRKAATLQLHLASAERAFALLDEPSDVEERPNAQLLGRARGAIAFRNVSFAYGKDRPVLHDISFDVEPGTRLGIVGASGAGKSTLIRLLTRVYDPMAGAIFLDGIDLRDFRLEDLRRQFAVVPQDPVLFSASIAENIAYARPGASESDLVAAAQAANAHEFIVRLPQAYDTQVGERGVQLSGGQRQRIAIARAFLKDSPVLILDEPTSAVDDEAEAVIVEAIRRLMRERTVILITHRSSLLENCTSLVVLENGRLVSDTTYAPVVLTSAIG